jgi:hypothetical protein
MRTLQLLEDDPLTASVANVVPVQNELRVTRTSIPGEGITTPSRQLSVASNKKPCKRVRFIDLRHIGLMTVAD